MAGYLARSAGEPIPAVTPADLRSGWELIHQSSAQAPGASFDIALLAISPQPSRYPDWINLIRTNFSSGWMIDAAERRSEPPCVSMRFCWVYQKSACSRMAAQNVGP
jgi:hypothetical protein